MTAPTYRSLTVRTPVDLYLEIAEIAQNEGECLNVIINRLLRLGLGKQIDLTEALHRLVMKNI